MAQSSVYHRIYSVVRRIPPGRVATYGQVAALVRGCSGARQVGYALHALADGTPVPWHRVVNAQGARSLHGASAVTQMLRLEHEGVRFRTDGRIDLKLYRWRPKKTARL